MTPDFEPIDAKSWRIPPCRSTSEALSVHSPLVDAYGTVWVGARTLWPNKRSYVLYSLAYNWRNFQVKTRHSSADEIAKRDFSRSAAICHADSPVWNLLASPQTIAVNVTWMKRGFKLVKRIAACIPIYLQPFLSNSTRKFKSSPRHFSTFLHILASSGYVPVIIAVNVTWMERGSNAGQTHSRL